MPEWLVREWSRREREQHAWFVRHPQINSAMQDQFGRKCKARTLSVEMRTPACTHNLHSQFLTWCLLNNTWNDFIFEFRHIGFWVVTGSSGMFRRDFLPVRDGGVQAAGVRCSRPWDPTFAKTRRTQIKHGKEKADLGEKTGGNTRLEQIDSESETFWEPWTSWNHIGHWLQFSKDYAGFHLRSPKYGCIT